MSSDPHTLYNIFHEDESYWYLKDKNGEVIDITADGFKTKVAYNDGLQREFAKEPSDNCKILIDKVINHGFKIKKERYLEDSVDKISFAKYLKENKREWTAKKLDERFGYKDTCSHWFRTDNGFSFPSIDDYVLLKKILPLDDKYDKEMLTFKYVADSNDIIKSLELQKIPVMPKHRYVFVSASTREKKEILSSLKVSKLKYPKGENIRYDARYTPTTQLILF